MIEITQEEFDKIYDEKTSWLDSRKHRQSYILNECSKIEIELKEKYEIIWWE